MRGTALVLAFFVVLGIQASTGAALGALDCTGAIPIHVGDTVHGDNTGTPANVTTYSCTANSHSSGEVVYELTLEGPDTYVLGVSLLRSDSNIHVFLLGSCDETDCIRYDAQSFTTDGLASGTYYIVVDGRYGHEGPYTLIVADMSPHEGCGPLSQACYDFDFGLSDNGFATEGCGGDGVWEWGADSGVPTEDCYGRAVTNVLGTVIGGQYPDGAGEMAVLGPVSITADCHCMEVCHYMHCEELYDGGCVKISADGGSTWEMAQPSSGYDSILEYDPACLADEPAYSTHGESEFSVDYFDLSGYIGQEASIGFFFGSDDGETADGWYISSVRIGRSDTPVEGTSWGAIKAMYR